MQEAMHSWPSMPDTNLVLTFACGMLGDCMDVRIADILNQTIEELFHWSKARVPIEISAETEGGEAWQWDIGYIYTRNGNS